MASYSGRELIRGHRVVIFFRTDVDSAINEIVKDTIEEGVISFFVCIVDGLDRISRRIATPLTG